MSYSPLETVSDVIRIPSSIKDSEACTPLVIQIVAAVAVLAIVVTLIALGATGTLTPSSSTTPAVNVSSSTATSTGIHNSSSSAAVASLSSSVLNHSSSAVAVALSSSILNHSSSGAVSSSGDMSSSAPVSSSGSSSLSSSISSSSSGNELYMFVPNYQVIFPSYTDLTGDGYLTQVQGTQQTGEYQLLSDQVYGEVLAVESQMAQLVTNYSLGDSFTVIITVNPAPFPASYYPYCTTPCAVNYYTLVAGTLNYNPTSEFLILLYNTGGANLAVGFNNGTVGAPIVAGINTTGSGVNASIPFNQWTTIAVTYESTTQMMSLYLNGSISARQFIRVEVWSQRLWNGSNTDYVGFFKNYVGSTGNDTFAGSVKYIEMANISYPLVVIANDYASILALQPI